MSRYEKQFQINADWQTVHNAVEQYLTAEGYEYLTYEGENVFKKGTGALSGPTFFKFSYLGNTVKMETWMKYAILPGVFVGELNTTGFVGSAAKGPWKKRINCIEQLLGNFAADNTYRQQAPYDIDPMPYQDPLQTNNTVVCTTCGAYIPASAELCPNCGCRNVMQTPVSQYVSRKEFIEKYAEPNIRKSILSVAILCYVCAASTLIFSIMTNPLGIIDAAVLLGLTLAMHIGKNKVCAILLLPLGIIECAVSLITIGSFPFLWLIAGIAAVVTFKKADKQYDRFINRQ